MILYICIGFAAGIISGMGIGGGTLLIPALCIFLGMNQQSAQNVNLIYFLPTACIALVSHAKDGNIDKKVIPGLILYGLFSAVLGSYLAIKIDSGILRRMFGFFLLTMGVVEIMKRDNKNKKDKAEK